MDINQPTKTFISKIVCVLGGILIGLTISKFSARQAYDWGFNNGVASHEDYRMQSCMAWWFDDSAYRIEQARIWMCGNDLRKKR
jgi:hypothetical protein